MKIEEKGLKDDENKIMLDLIYPYWIEEIGKVLTYGAKKYKPNSWQNTQDGINKHYAAALRHILAFRKGEVFDKESGLNHLSHAISNLFFVMDHEKEGRK